MALKKILAVDDEERILGLIAEILLSNGYEVVTAKSGGGAIRKTKKYRPDLIIMDILMPDLDGAETVKILQENPATRNIPILFISEGALETNYKVGGVSYTALAKPFNTHELLTAVGSLLAH
jgi:DNA-binding response OmpR family regulator